MAFNPKEAVTIARKLGHDPDLEVVLKAQVQVPLRNKGYFVKSNLQGGIHVAKNLTEVEELAEKMLMQRFVSGLEQDFIIHKSKGWPVNALLIQEKLKVDREFAVRICYDRKNQRPIITYTANGGRPIRWVE